ncbi:MAG: hypothetical protein MR712_06870, partial [Bacteroidales bacterium]|nr:hypothetical protein [Bacteroidales bacterium]
LPKALCLFLDKASEDKAKESHKGGKTVSLANALLYMPQANRHSNRRYPILYVTEDSEGKFSETLSQVADSMAMTANLSPIIICRLYKDNAVDDEIRIVQSLCPAIRRGKRFSKIISATNLQADLRGLLVDIDRQMHK